MGLRIGCSRCAAAVGIVGASWFGMQAVHELGHVLAAWATAEMTFHFGGHGVLISVVGLSLTSHYV